MNRMTPFEINDALIDTLGPAAQPHDAVESFKIRGTGDQITAVLVYVAAGHPKRRKTFRWTDKDTVVDYNVALCGVFDLDPDRTVWYLAEGDVDGFRLTIEVIPEPADDAAMTTLPPPDDIREF